MSARLMKLKEIYDCIPCATAKLESDFSITGLFTHGRHNQLSVSICTALMLFREDDEAIQNIEFVLRKLKYF